LLYKAKTFPKWREYTIKQDNMYVLHPMENKLFRSWRNERLLKLKEQKEAIKKETEAATIITAFV
jgi:hypothetical protein